jgi:hypothetical protein
VLLPVILAAYRSGEAARSPERIPTAANLAFAYNGDLGTGFAGCCGRSQSCKPRANYQNIGSDYFHTKPESAVR